MSIVDSMFDQFYEHLMDCPKCSQVEGTGEILVGGVAVDCEKGNRMKRALKKLNEDI